MRDFLKNISISKEGMFLAAIAFYIFSFFADENFSLVCFLTAAMYWCTGAILGSLKENR